MIIKYYTNDPQPLIVILENVSDVTVFQDEPEIEGEFTTLNFDNQVGGTHPCITYADDGVRLLHVYGTAYICNNDGKTIEKVSA